MAYTVKQLADLAGVSTRTLHYYDQIGLLRPEKVARNGYRSYSDPAMLRLQQILFFKELGFSLEEIRRSWTGPGSTCCRRCACTKSGCKSGWSA